MPGTLRLMVVLCGLRLGASGFLSVALLVGCTGSSGEEDCGPSAGCAPGFKYEGGFYSIGCLGVAPANLGPDVGVVRVNTDNKAKPVRTITGWTAQQALAVRVPTAGCGNPGDGTSDWSLSFPLRGPEGRAQEAVITCAVALAGAGVRESLKCSPPNG